MTVNVIISLGRNDTRFYTQSGCRLVSDFIFSPREVSTDTRLLINMKIY